MKTTVNGKEIRLFGNADIGSMFTTIIQNYLNCGFTFNYAESSGGTQGEDMRADLTNNGGKTVYRVYVDKVHKDFNDCVCIVVEKFTDCNEKSTLWQGRGEKISEKKLWQICDSRKNKTYVESKEDFEAVKKLQDSRLYARYKLEDSKASVNLPATANKIGLILVRKIKGYKGTKLDQITKVEHCLGFGYVVHLNKGTRSEKHNFKTVK